MIAPMKPPVAELSCPRCGYDLRAQVALRADRCSECSMVLPSIPQEPAETYLERYAHCLAAMRERFKRGWHDELSERSEGNWPLYLLLAFGLILLWSGIEPKDRFTWFLEVAPALMGAAVLIATYRRFRFTHLTYFLIFVHACILCVGGHYTYAEVPIGNWIRDWLNLSRNHFDRLGHLAQGFVPAIVARELLIRCSPLGMSSPAAASGRRHSRWLFFIVTSICVAISALYELIEWQVAIWTGTAAEAFLGTQGDVWDTQKDMALALVGAILAQLLLARLHNRQIVAVCAPNQAGQNK